MNNVADSKPITHNVDEVFESIGLYQSKRDQQIKIALVAFAVSGFSAGSVIARALMVILDIDSDPRLLILFYFLMLVAVFVWNNARRTIRYYEDKIAYYTKEVPQGKILQLTHRGGGKTDLECCVLIEGYARNNTLCTDTHPVNAGEWTKSANGDGKYSVGKYFNIDEEISTD